MQFSIHHKGLILFHILAIMISTAVFTGCGDPINAVGELTLEENWQRQGFEDSEITVLKNDGEGLLIGTKDGLFQLKGDTFMSLGLEGEEVRSIIRLKGNDLLAGVKTLPSELPPLVRSQDEGRNWEAFQNGFHDDASSLDSTIPVSDTLFAQGSATRAIVRSTDSDRSWEIAAGNWDTKGGSGVFIKVDPFHPGRIWSGGTSAFFQPYLTKILDYADRWEGAGVDGNTEGITFDVVTHPEDPDLVLAGLGGSFAKANTVRKSTDGGQSWQIVLEETGIHSFARSVRNPDVIYAGGRDPSTRLFFAVTADFGETWQKEIFEEGPSVVTTNDLAVKMIDGKEMLFLGTDQGLFSYTLEQ